MSYLELPTLQVMGIKEITTREVERDMSNQVAGMKVKVTEFEADNAALRRWVKEVEDEFQYMDLKHRDDMETQLYKEFEEMAERNLEKNSFKEQITQLRQDIARREDEIDWWKEKFTRLYKEFQEMLEIKISIDKEIKTYMQLLEDEESRVGLLTSQETSGGIRQDVCSAGMDECQVPKPAGCPQENEEMTSCQDQCPKLMQCGHRCSKVCHLGDCSSVEMCEKKVKISCPCKKRKEEFRCSQANVKQDLVACDGNCKEAPEWLAGVRQRFPARGDKNFGRGGRRLVVSGRTGMVVEEKYKPELMLTEAPPKGDYHEWKSYVVEEAAAYMLGKYEE